MIKDILIEDHQSLLDVVRRKLKRWGFDEVTEEKGMGAVAKAIEEKPQLILMDIMMPGMDGREATRLIRANAETQNIPILAATVLFRESDINSCLEAGCNGFILKPFTFDELKGKIQEFITDLHPTLQ